MSLVKTLLFIINHFSSLHWTWKRAELEPVARYRCQNFYWYLIPWNVYIGSKFQALCPCDDIGFMICISLTLIEQCEATLAICWISNDWMVLSQLVKYLLLSANHQTLYVNIKRRVLQTNIKSRCSICKSFFKQSWHCLRLRVIREWTMFLLIKIETYYHLSLDLEHEAIYTLHLHITCSVRLTPRLTCQTSNSSHFM